MKRLCLILLCAAACFAADDKIAVLRQTVGDVTVRHGDQWTPVSKTPVDLYDGDKVATNRGRAEVFYPSDGSLLTLDVGSNMTIHQTSGSGGGWLRHIQVFAGDVFFHVTKVTETRNKWQLSTPTAIGGVIGTEGQIHVEDQHDSQFSLSEGRLEVFRVGPNGEALGDGSVHINAGEGIHALWGKPFEHFTLNAPLKPPRLDVRPDELPEHKGHKDLPEGERPPKGKRDKDKDEKGEKPKHRRPHHP